MKTSKVYSRSLKQLVSLLLLMVAVRGILWACGGDYSDWDIGPRIFFQPDIADDKKENEHFYYTYTMLNNFISGEEYPDSAYDDNINDWYNYFDKKILQEDIEHFMYRARSFGFTKETTLRQFTNAYGNDNMIGYLVKKKNYKVLNYLMLAKGNEFSADALNDGWNDFNSYDFYGADSLRNNVVQADITNALVFALNKEKDPFFKQRLAFQLIRNYRYTYHSTSVDSLFLLYFSNAPHDFLYGNALNYATDALVNAGQQTKANYYAALLFHEKNGNKYRAYFNTSRQVAIDSVLAYTQNDKERSMVYSMYAFRDFYPNSFYITKAAQLDPSNTSIHDLIIREINKLDAKILPEIKGYGMVYSNPEENVELMDGNGHLIFTYPGGTENYNNLVELLRGLQSLNNANKSFYTLCLGHLALINKDFKEAYDYLDATSEKLLSPKQQAQLHITRTLLFIQSRNMRQVQQQEFLYREMNYLAQHKDLVYNHEFVMQGIMALAAHKLIADGDYARAYFLSKGLNEQYGDMDILDNYARPEDIDTILYIIAHPRNEFDKQLVSYNPHSTEILHTIQGSLYMRQNNLAMANKSFAKVSTVYTPINLKRLNTNPDGHPFNVYNYDFMEAGEYTTQADADAHNNRVKDLRLEYDAYSITKEMLQLKQKIANKQGDMGEHYYYLASLYFELTYHGRAYEVLDYQDTWSINEMDYMEYRTNKAPYMAHYYGAEWAMPYYRLALKHTKNKEIAARCLYALFRCNRYDQIYHQKQNGNEDLKYLFRLHDQYANTDYYRIKECWGLSAYVEGLRAGSEDRN